MVNTVLALSTGELVGADEAQSINLYIDDLISKHSKNSEVMNLMALEATSLATSVESRSKDLEGQGFLKRGWNTLTGKNQKVSARNSHDLAQGQYLGQQMLNKLAENNLMTFQIVMALGDKLNRVAQETNEAKLEVAELNQTLANFFVDIRQKLESKFNALERNDNLLFWKETMMFEPVYQGRVYSELSRVEKVVCLANDFYNHSEQKWAPRDLFFLKSILVQVGHQPTEKLTLKEVYQEYQREPELLDKLLNGLELKDGLSMATELTPTLLTFDKFHKLANEERTIVDTVQKYSPSISRNDLMLDLAEGYINDESGRDLSCEITMFDAVMDLVEDLVLYKPQVTGMALLELEERNNNDVNHTLDSLSVSQEGNPEFQYWLAVGHLNGWLMELDVNKAHNLLRESAKSGRYEAIELLGQFYEQEAWKDDNKCDVDFDPSQSRIFIEAGMVVWADKAGSILKERKKIEAKLKREAKKKLEEEAFEQSIYGQVLKRHKRAMGLK